MKRKVRISYILFLVTIVGLCRLSLPAEKSEKPEKSDIRTKRACGRTVDSYVMPEVWHGFIPRQNARKIIWGSIFDCEEWMLEIKLNEIGHLVDHFIIVEGLYSLQNKKRQQCFPQIVEGNSRISKWLPKIVYIYDTSLVKGFQYWEAEVYYRDLIGLQGLSSLSLKDDDLIVVSDMDELLSRQFLHFLKWNEGFSTLIQVKLLWSYYAFFWVNPNLVQKGMVSSIKELSMLGHNKTNALRFNLFGAQQGAWTPSKIAGWHCSWCIPTANFVSKMQNFAHAELNTADHSSIAFLSKMRMHGLWFPDQQPNACIQSYLQLPEYVQANKNRFRELAVIP